MTDKFGTTLMVLFCLQTSVISYGLNGWANSFGAEMPFLMYPFLFWEGIFFAFLTIAIQIKRRKES